MTEQTKYYSLRAYVADTSKDDVLDLLEKLGAAMEREGLDVMNAQRSRRVVSYSQVVLQAIVEAAEKRGFDGQKIR